MSQETKALWDEEAKKTLVEMGAEETLVDAILSKGFHLKVYELQDGIVHRSVCLYNQKKDFAIAVIIFTNTGNNKEALEALRLRAGELGVRP